MTPAQLQAKLDELLALPGETEWVEFKEAKNNFDTDELGKYFSALSNEANLKERPYGWLVFGVKDGPQQVVGTNYRPSRPALDSLKQEVARETSYGLTFHEIYELTTPQGRVVLFQIPAAPRGMPTTWKGFCYGRNGESRGALSFGELDQIRAQAGVRPPTTQRNGNAFFGELDQIRAQAGVRPPTTQRNGNAFSRFRNPYDFIHVASGEVFKELRKNNLSNFGVVIMPA